MQPASAFICGLCFCLVFVDSLFAQSVPRERRITHREKSLKTYDPFSPEELWQKIKIPPAPTFRLELVAAEPLVVDPVQFEFDLGGRILRLDARHRR
ncbi:MAG: hypothetical protein ACJASX_001130 [Limisphaerales bacterium]|jgi:hypothetical protein